MLRPFAHPVACCWMWLRVVAQSLKPFKLFSQQQLPTFLLFRDRRRVAQQCWIRLASGTVSSSGPLERNHREIFRWVRRLEIWEGALVVECFID